jgi:PAS domain S-box-containing protein
MKRDFHRFSFSVQVLILLVIITLIITGIWFYRIQKNSMDQKVGNDLTAIARLKADQIFRWRSEQLRTASALKENRFILKSVETFLSVSSTDNSNELHARLSLVSKQENYSKILLIDTKGHILFTRGENGGVAEAYRSALSVALQTRNPVLTDIYLDPQGGPSQISVVAPLYSESGQILGCLVLVTNVSQYLYPLVQYWPTQSKTAETYLVEQDGDHVLFLNNLRYQPETALHLKIPLTQWDNPAVMAVRGIAGIFFGKDYRGAKVVGASFPVSESPWFIVAKMDAPEVYAEWRFKSILMLALIFGTVGLVGGAGLLWSLKEKELHYKALYDSEYKLRIAMERNSITLKSIGDAVIVTDNLGIVDLMNPVAEKLTGWMNTEAYGKHLEEVFRIINEETRETVENPVSKVLREGRVVGLANHTLLIGKDGTERPIADSGAPVRGSENKIIGVVLVFRDQTDERAARKALLQSEEKFRDLFHKDTAVKLLVDPTTSDILDANEAAEKFYGWSKEKLRNMKVQDINILSPEQIKAEVENARSSYRAFFEFRHRLADDSVKDVAVYSSLIDIRDDKVLHMIVHDISERKKAEQEQENLRDQLTQAQKMESIGLLAGGVAHDYNNMLTVIIGYAMMAKEYATEGEPLSDDLDEIINAGRRSVDITKKLLAFARKQTIDPIVIDFNATVSGMLSMLRRLIGENIDLAWKPSAELWNVKMDPSQVDQILANLCVNARDAITDVGHITIETRNISFDKTYCNNHYGFVPGDFTLLAVSDDGCGMSKEMINHIFEPFYTTKSAGRGTGLGLATVYGIVKQNNGFINVYSEPGKGSTFRLYFPRVMGEESKVIEDIAAIIPPGHSETVLLVEDEQAILKMTKRMLERLGYQVLTAGTPNEAVTLGIEHSKSICLLLTDVILPEMTGRDLSDLLQKRITGLKTLFMSGYTANAIAHHGVLDAGVHFISKPFSQDDLAIKISKILGRIPVNGER